MFDGNCDIQVDLDPPDKFEFTSDESISGTVTVEVSDDVTCNGLNVELGWKAHGRGNHASQAVISETLFSGEWSAGETHEYRFDIELPEGPFTYHGDYLNVDWELTATADIPWALDPSYTTDFVLAPGAAPENPIIGETTAAQYADDRSDDEPTIKWIALIFGLVFGAVGLFLMALVPTADAAIMPILFGLVFLGFGGWMTYEGVKNYFAERKLGDVDVNLSSLKVSPGGELGCHVRMKPSGAVELNALNITLEGLEKVVSGHGTDKTTYRNQIHQNAVVAEGSIETTLTGGSPVEFSESLRIPEDAPCTFDASDNELIWRFKVHIDIPGWPDWEHKQKLLVVPGAQQATDEQLNQPTADAANQQSTAIEETESDIESGDGADITW